MGQLPRRLLAALVVLTGLAGCRMTPGLVSTRWFKQRFGEDAGSAQEQSFASETPLGVVATPDHVAQAVAALKPGAYVELFFPPL